jgi:RNA polymerase sigma-70 factor (ECF subfamily)
MLIHWDGFSIVEAAEILGLNASTVRGRYAAAREALKSALVDAART